MTHQDFVTLTRGLNRNSPPMRLFEKAKNLGTWNPSDLDFSKDIEDWKALTKREQTVFLHLTSLFQSGEEAVTINLLPLISAIAGEGRLEEALYLTTFLFEEAKHTDLFNRFLANVACYDGDLNQFAGQNYRAIVYEALPQALQRLKIDPSPEAQVEASVTYNMIVEGVLAETGYHAYFNILDRNQLMPGLRSGVTLLKQDESRHIAYGLYLLSRLVAENKQLWDVLERKMNTLLPQAVMVVSDIFDSYRPMPFELSIEDYVDFAMNQFSKRFARLEKARDSTLEEIYQSTTHIIDQET